MNKSTVKQLHTLCARTESLQIKLAAVAQLRHGRTKRNEDAQRIYESVKAAKNELLDALRLAEGQ